MSGDRLAKIKAWRALPVIANRPAGDQTIEYVDWLVAEVERLRGLLARAEWAATEVDWDEPDAWSVCPDCHHPQTTGHGPGCELAAELGRETVYEQES
jgi:hypothetical protein